MREKKNERIAIKSTAFSCCCFCCWVEKVYFQVQFFFIHSFLLCTLCSSGFRFAGSIFSSFCACCICLCATFEYVIRSFRLNSCEYKFKQIVRHVCIHIWMYVCTIYTNKNEWYTTKRVNSLSCFFIFCKFMRAQQCQS